jgi:hypothetical protein
MTGRSAADRDTAATERANAQVLTHHTLALAGEVWSRWRCVRCGRDFGPFGRGVQITEADCVPRRWGGGAA